MPPQELIIQLWTDLGIADFCVAVLLFEKKDLKFHGYDHEDYNNAFFREIAFFLYMGNVLLQANIWTTVPLF